MAGPLSEICSGLPHKATLHSLLLASIFFRLFPCFLTSGRKVETLILASIYFCLHLRIDSFQFWWCQVVRLIIWLMWLEANKSWKSLWFLCFLAGALIQIIMLHFCFASERCLRCERCTYRDFSHLFINAFKRLKNFYCLVKSVSLYYLEELVCDSLD